MRTVIGRQTQSPVSGSEEAQSRGTPIHVQDRGSYFFSLGLILLWMMLMICVNSLQKGNVQTWLPKALSMSYFLVFFLTIFLNWSIINLKCCVSCGYVAKRFSYTHLHIHILLFSLLNHVPFFATPWPVAHQAPLSVAFPREEYWSGLPFPSPGDLPGSGIKPTSSVLQVDFFYHCATREAHIYTYNIYVYIYSFSLLVITRYWI